MWFFKVYLGDFFIKYLIDNMADNNEPGDHLIYHKIGEQLRKHRKERDLKLLDLASMTNIGSAMLSKIENGRLIPTIPTLFTIINKLGVAPDVFFAELNAENKFPGYFFLPRSGFSPYVKEESAVGFDYLSILEHSVEGGAFQVSLLRLKPGAKRTAISTAAFEFIYLVKGDIIFELEDKSFVMKEGDALFFDGNIAHVPVNKSRKTVVMLVFYIFNNTKI